MNKLTQINCLANNYTSLYCEVQKENFLKLIKYMRLLLTKTFFTDFVK